MHTIIHIFEENIAHNALDKHLRLIDNRLFYCLNAVCEMLLNVVICVLYGNIVYNAQNFTLVMR